MKQLSNLHISISSKLKSIREMFPVKNINKYKKDSIGVINFVIDYLSENDDKFSFLVDKDVFINLIFVDDSMIKKINLDYRNKNESTNVISIAYFSAEDFYAPDNLFNLHLGEIFISFSTLYKESIEQEIFIEHHFFRLLIHGMLHLLGFDHEIEKDAIIMYNTEEAILNKLKLSTESIVSNYWS